MANTASVEGRQPLVLPSLARRKLSVAMIVRDEAYRVGPSLDAISCADEIVVVDGGSTDATAEICRTHGCRVLTRPFAGFGSQKRFAVAQCRNDWILNLDADEVLTPALNEEILALLARPSIPEAAFRLEMQLVFLGRPFRYGKHARESHVRLFDRTRAGYDDALVHEGVRTAGPVGRLRNRLLHYSYQDLSHVLRKIDEYTTLGACVLRTKGKRRSAALSVLLWHFYFLKSYVLERNFLNGARGLIWSFFASLHPVVKYLKLVEQELRV